MTDTPRPSCVHYVSFRAAKHAFAYQICGDPRVTYRRWDVHSPYNFDPNDIVVFAEGEETQPIAKRNATDLDERWL